MSRDAVEKNDCARAAYRSAEMTRAIVGGKRRWVQRAHALPVAIQILFDRGKKIGPSSLSLSETR
jgi:hypothetical protein